jgi:hypothetical protein
MIFSFMISCLNVKGLIGLETNDIGMEFVVEGFERPLSPCCYWTVFLRFLIKNL